MGFDTKKGNVTTLLNAVTSTGTSDYLDCSINKNITFQIIAASVSTGGTVDIEASLDGTNYGVISTNAISGNGSTFFTISQKVYKYLRANLSARTDGTYTVKVIRQS